MKQLTVPHIAIKDPLDRQRTGSRIECFTETINGRSPPGRLFLYKPAVEFVIAYQESHLFLKYFVTEKAICAVASQANGMVWEDSRGMLHQL